MPLPQKRLIPGLLLALAIAALAAPPLWWNEGNPPVIDPAAAENNHGPANIGQAKHIAKSALDALRPILPAVADQIEADLVGSGKPIPSWAAPANQAEIDKNHAPLLIGQLKAIADPFYNRLHAAAPAWLEAERVLNATNHPGSIFPWTSAATDDDNKGMANIGQLKAVFSLRFEHDADIDGMPGLWEEAVGLDQDDPGDADTDLDDDGLTNLGEYENGTDPAWPDSDLDGTTDGDEVLQGTNPKDPSKKPVAEWFVLTGNLGPEEVKSRSRTVTIPKGKSRLLVVALHSEEYPGYTENFSEFDDLLTWDIRPQGKDPVTGEVHVNDRHTDWELALVDGVEILGFSPAHIETSAKYSAPGDSDLVIEIDLSATNVSDGSLPSTVMVGLLPVEIEDNLVATGVDAVSKTAATGDVGYMEDFWIMAPLQGPPLPNGKAYENLTKLSIGMGGSATGKLSAANATPDTDMADEAVSDQIALNGEPLDVLWQGLGTGVDSEAPVKTNINGSGEYFPLPVKVKAMKYREVTVDVYPLRKNSTARNVPLPEGDPNDLKDLETHLNTVFAYQLNVWFDVQYHPQTVYGYDPDNNSYVGLFETEISDLATDDVYRIDNKHIRIFLLDSVNIREFNGLEGQLYRGRAYPDGDMAIIWTGLNAGNQPLHQEIWRTTAHEIGHIFRLEGHPDQNQGPAPLPGTNQSMRLMHSVDYIQPGAKILVKKEWDVIETRLKVKLEE